ncbi:Putative troponin i [Gryllus bimaculatus]|nr:Putative troponin i [Gryllus bimaculatus]
MADDEVSTYLKRRVWSFLRVVSRDISYSNNTQHYSRAAHLHRATEVQPKDSPHRAQDTLAKKAKQAEIERKRAEVRKRLEEASKAKKAKKGFMTPERKKKLRLLLRKKAAEELKKEQERKAAERRRIIEERCGKPKNVDDANEETVKRVLREYHNRINALEDEKYDLEYTVKKKDFEVEKTCVIITTPSSVSHFLLITTISDLNSQVNDLRGKFMKPTLKKVSKYENKFAKLQKKAAEFNFRNQLKVVKKKEFTLEEEDKEKKPDWSKKGDKVEEKVEA